MWVQPPDAPPEVKEWAQNTVVGVLVGIIYGGGRQYLADRAAGATTRPPGTARAACAPGLAPALCMAVIVARLMDVLSPGPS